MACTTISDDMIEFWLVVWKAKVPNKVKFVMWRAWNNYVPTIDNLQSRGLNQTSSCTYCGETTESIVHVMFKCSTKKVLSSRMGAIHDDIVGTVDEKKQTFSWPVKWEEVERLLALTTPPPSPLTPLSSPLPQIPSPTPNSPTHIEIPESCLPLRKRVRFSSPTPSREVGESSAASAARQDRPTILRDDPYSIAREDLYGFVDMVDVPPRCS
ncbi:putative reverse transcriptase domain-containing protein, partial [Tanacetum coccineum]